MPLSHENIEKTGFWSSGHQGSSAMVLDLPARSTKPVRASQSNRPPSIYRPSISCILAMLRGTPLSMTLALKDLPDLFGMALSELGGKARRVEVQRWIGDYVRQNDLNWTTHDYLDVNWQYKVGWAIELLSKQGVIVKNPGPGNINRWSFSS